MKILIVSKFFYMRGGAELVAVNTRRLLMQHDHDVRVFAMDFDKNIKVPESVDFPETVDFFDSLTNKLKAVRRMLGKGDVAEKARRVLKDFSPDVVHLHNVHSYLSPVIAEIAHEMGIKVVWTLHDYKLICPAYSCRRGDGQICEECFAGSPAPVLRNRCMKGSLPAGVMAWWEARQWSKKRLDAMTDIFIAPSQFMAKKMTEAGYAPEKITVLCNFADPDKIEELTSLQSSPKSDEAPYFCYIGRLSEEKGVETMIRAACAAGVNLKIAGGGPLEKELRDKYGSSRNIEFLGHQDAKGVARLLNGAVASVLPSEWYENNPLGVIESLSTGTPVIGADMGGIPELICSEATADTPRNGVVYPSRDVEVLTEVFRNFDLSDYDPKAIAAAARRDFSTEDHYRKLISIYSGK